MNRSPLVLCLTAAAGIAVAADSPRERICLNDDWRFTKGDPNGDSSGLRYDVRPDVKDRKDDRAADAEPTAAEEIAATNQPVLKPWILPTGNRFIKDPAKRRARPAESRAATASYMQPDFDDSSWRQVKLPHDWAIDGPFNSGGVGGGMGRLPSPGVGWYRKKLDIPASDAGKSIFLDVDGAMSYAVVWLNGHLAGGWPYGYASWRVDLTPYIVPGGKNQLAIRLDNPPDSSRWYPGGGIYRNVWLTKAHPLHIGQSGTYLTTRNASKSFAEIYFEVTIDNNSKTEAMVAVATEIFALNAVGRKTGNPVARIASVNTTVAAGASSKAQSSTTLANPKLWGPPPTQQPNRYVAVTTVSQDGQMVDRYETRFGVRDVRFDPRNGVVVNGERIPIRGVNQHHDLGALGAAFNHRAAQRQLEILQEMGCNAIRTAHNPPAPELLELTDQMGFLVVDEIFDAWQRKKTPLDFHLIFPDWSEPEFANFGGIKTPPLYPAFHEGFPDRVIVSSESAAALSSRGVYLFPVASAISNPTRDGKGGDSKIHQVSAYELHTADFGSSADKVFAAQDKNPFVAGESVWCGWDYLGEPTPYYSSRSSYYGIIDLAGFKKDRFCLYQSRWQPELRFAHILPHWTWPERVGQVTPVHVFTSGDEAELFLNGKSLGRKKKGQYEYRLRWDDVVYQPGTLKVVSYKNGAKWATAEMKTAGNPAKLKLEPDRNEIHADSNDLSFVTVTVADKAGSTSPRADNRIRFDIEGPGEIVATDNGDPTSFELFQSHDREAFNGLCLVIVRGQAGQPGKIKLTAKADGLKAGTISIKTVPNEN